MLYVHAGGLHRSELETWVAKESRDRNFFVDEFDMSLLEEPGESCWDELLHDARDGCYNLIYISPPSATFSRSALAGSSARTPLRDERWPEGYPWLRGKPLKQAEAGTRAVRRVLDLVRAASMLYIPWLWEHPEHLGATAGGMRASVWTWSETRKFFEACTVALVQCSFGASSRRPTRLTGTWHGIGTLGHSGWPVLDRDGRFVYLFTSVLLTWFVQHLALVVLARRRDNFIVGLLTDKRIAHALAIP